MRVEEVLRQRRAQGKGSLIGYFPAGYPTVADSVDALVAMAHEGCNILEVGVPYSDPVMDGEVIQRATELALSNGFKLAMLFEAIQKVRQQTDVPMLVMSYWNPVIRYGLDEFAKQLTESGAQGMITPDLIPDEAASWLEVSDRAGLERVFLVAPSSSPARTKQNAEASRGFVYAVSTMGITGERAELDRLARSVTEGIRAVSDIPVCVGVGVSNGAQVAEVNSYADGAIVGTAIIRAYEEGGLEALRVKVGELARGLG
jgi:tryptophan synthase alpha chain